jgi:hypothetical protein
MEFYHRVTQPEPLYRRRSKQNSYDDILLHMSDCTGSLHPRAKKGLQLFNAGEYFEAHEALEDAWNAEEGSAKNLYRGILQTAVVYLHITRLGAVAGGVNTAILSADHLPPLRGR